MESTPLPEPLRRAVHHLVSETVQNCQEVLRYTEPDQAHTWKRMTLYRATDAADTMNMVAMLIAAYCQHTGMAADTLQSYLQVGQQELRAAGPQDDDRAHVAGLMGEALSYEALRAPANRMRHHRGQRQAEQAQRPEDDPQKLFTEACLHGLRARLCDDVDALDSYLPPQVAQLARKVAEALEVPELATT
ncbi:hypothetical protein PV367_16865 [Streptomyces europaeiscabiei]|uniref:Uncharacterized protein n=1 Tax=Streptomyces europaeiscabiei TaxID=146819 RepID=A0AAJ2PQ57_9ACTN|nr:hypothetical protein [Streptomyces europaeiscabiei]MDX3131410.1 hypothetical protein [Streptomyces europaeiscabiei]